MPASDYDSSRVLCRRCLERDINGQDLRAYLDDYVRQLPEDLRTGAHEYARRLALCDACPLRTGFTCTACGCYVQARAAKALQRCPQRRW